MQQHASPPVRMKTSYKILITLLLCVAVLKIIQYYFILQEEPKSNIDSLQPSTVDVSDPNKITVSVYYEALCPDSRRFILEQLLPAYELIPNNIILNLIPYGKANTKETNQELTFSCQHGPTECLANKIHACAIKYTAHTPFIQLKYIACMINDNYDPDNAGRKCGTEVQVDYSPIANCSVSRMGDLLLKNNGVMTKALNPRAAFIPTVQLNGEHKLPQEEVLQNFLSEVCKTLVVKPDECF